MPDLHAAYSIYADPDPLCRWTLEARLLTGEAMGGIASRLGLGEGAVVAFEKVFFDVVDVDRRGSDYTWLIAVGLHPGSTTPSPGKVWKMLAYLGGPAVLDFVLGIDHDLARPEMPEQLDAFMRSRVLDGLLLKAAVAALTLPVDAHSAPMWIDLYRRGLEGRNRARESASALEAIRPNVMAMWDGLPSILKAGLGPTTRTPAGSTTPGSDGSSPAPTG